MLVRSAYPASPGPHHNLPEQGEIVSVPGAHLLQHVHHRTDILQVLNLATQLAGSLPHVQVKGVQLVCSLFVQFLGKLLFPAGSFAQQACLDWSRGYAQWSNVLRWADSMQPQLNASVLLQFLLKVFHGGLSSNKTLILIVQRLQPQERKLTEHLNVGSDLNPNPQCPNVTQKTSHTKGYFHIGMNM